MAVGTQQKRDDWLKAKLDEGTTCVKLIIPPHPTRKLYHYSCSGREYSHSKVCQKMLRKVKTLSLCCQLNLSLFQFVQRKPECSKVAVLKAKRTKLYQLSLRIRKQMAAHIYLAQFSPFKRGCTICSFQARIKCSVQVPVMSTISL